MGAWSTQAAFWVAEESLGPQNTYRDREEKGPSGAVSSCDGGSDIHQHTPPPPSCSPPIFSSFDPWVFEEHQGRDWSQSCVEENKATALGSVDGARSAVGRRPHPTSVPPPRREGADPTEHCTDVQEHRKEGYKHRSPPRDSESKSVSHSSITPGLPATQHQSTPHRDPCHPQPHHTATSEARGTLRSHQSTMLVKMLDFF